MKPDLNEFWINYFRLDYDSLSHQKRISPYKVSLDQVIYSFIVLATKQGEVGNVHLRERKSNNFSKGIKSSKFF